MITAECVVPRQPVDKNWRLLAQERHHVLDHRLIAAQHAMRVHDAFRHRGRSGRQQNFRDGIRLDGGVRAIHGVGLACRKQRAQRSDHFDAAVRGSHGRIDGAVEPGAGPGKDQSRRQQPDRVLQRGEITRCRRIRG